MLETPAEVVETLRTDGRFARWPVRVEGDGFVEVQAGRSTLVLIWPEVWRNTMKLAPHLTRARSGTFPLVLLGTHADFAAGRVYRLDDPPTNSVAMLPLSVEQLLVIVRSQAAIAQRSRLMARRDVQLERARYEVDLLISVGRTLMRERDIDSLLSRILFKAREVTGADAGSVYVVEGYADDPAENQLRFTVTQNDSMPLESEGFTLPITSRSIVGSCVLSSQSINIPDLYALGEPGSDNNPWGFKHDRRFDDSIGYQTRAMLTVPMISARNQVIGVIQLINKRARGVTRLYDAEDFDRRVVPFDDGAVELAEALASQAGIALENARLYDEVRRLFEGFVHASVTAIESRDPTTSGHSQRVADLTVGLARVVDRIDTGPYADVTFTFDQLKEIEYASLLHDFGKVGVREHVLVKPKKLYNHEMDLVKERFNFIRKAIEAEQLDNKVRYLMEVSREEAAMHLSALDKAAAEKLAEIDEFLAFIIKANEPSVLERGGFERIAEIAARTFRDLSGAERPFLTDGEAAALQIPRGSLTPSERTAIEEHVVHTYHFLKQIPWGHSFRDVPEIAGAHHEKLDGSGYPSHKPASAIPVPARMMTISDIFDALTASDRPYKKAVPLDKALDILGYEVKAGKLDPVLLDVFVEAKVFELARVKRL